MSESIIFRALCPRVAVLSSPDVNVVAQDNGCDDFAELLRPFEAQIPNITVRTSQLESRQCSAFPLRIDQLDAFEEGKSSDTNRHPEEVLDAVTAHISAHARHWDSEIPRIEVAEKGDIRPEHVQTPIDHLTPWFADFRELILGNRAISEHESFGHPVAMLITVSTSCPDPMAAFAQLHEQSQQPAAYSHRPYMHLEVLRYYLVLHDTNRSGTDLAQTEALLEDVKKTYGLHCCILQVNSAAQGAQKSDGFSSMWSRALRKDPRAPLLRPNIATPEPPSQDGQSLGVPAAPARWRTPTLEEQQDGQQQKTSSESKDQSDSLRLELSDSDAAFGTLLDDEDVRRLKAFLREFVAQSLVPHMERSVQVWNEQVAASRTGLTGKLFGAGRRMFGGTRAATASQPPGFDAHRQLYPAAAVESLTRRLADFAFMTRDLRLAASLYETVRKDFVNDKAWKHAAGASEMLGVCQFLTGANNPAANFAEAEALLGQACHEYSLSNSQLSAIRASLLYYEAQRSVGAWRTVEPTLVRAAGFAEEISSAIFLEQAALANLRQPKPALRKYAVHLVMAGHRYKDCGQKHLSLRCYAQAGAFYRSRQWALIANHVEHELGKQAFMDGDADQAVEHLLRVLRPATGSTVPSETYLDELLSAHKYCNEQDGRRKHSQFAFELFPSERCKFDLALNSGTADSDPEWDQLEEHFMNTGYSSGMTGPDGKARKRPMQLKRTSAEVEVGLNELDISDIRPDISEETEAEATSDSGLDIESASDVRATPGELYMIPLQVTARREGRYRVRGVSFTISGAMRFIQTFEKKGPRLYATKENKTQLMYGPDRTLSLRVRGPRPQLQVELLDPPAYIYHGEETEVVARLLNVGHDDVHDVRLLTSDPGVFAAAKTAASSNAFVDQISILDSLLPETPTDISLPSARLAKGESVEVPMNLRASVPGVIVFRGLLVYQVGELVLSALESKADSVLYLQNGSGEVFTARMVHQIRVLPSLLVRADCSLLDREQPRAKLELHIQNASRDLCKVQLSAITILTPDRLIKLPAKSELKDLLHLLDPGSYERAPLPLGIEEDSKPDSDLLVRHLRSLLGVRLEDKAGSIPSYPQRSVNLQQVQLHSQTQVNQSVFLPAVRREWRLQSLASNFPAIGVVQRQRVFPLYDVDELDLIIHWEQDDQLHGTTRRGHIPLFGIRLGPLRNRLDNLVDGGKNIRSLYAETAKEQAAVLNNILDSPLGKTDNPLLLRVFSESDFRHDFTTGPARIPVNFSVRNMSNRQRAGYTLSLLHSEADLSTVQEIAPWVGRSTFRGALAPGEARVVTGQMLVESPAVVSSGAWVGEVQVEGLNGPTFSVMGTDRAIVTVRAAA
ncbi:hypothetical protein OC845_004521 [Tilletia horrida]|nr:hypothetical protein OC845_004521 [Tilletia horrida]